MEKIRFPHWAVHGNGHHKHVEVRVEEWEGRERIDIRLWKYNPQKGWIATPKGVWFPSTPEKAEELAQVFTEVAAYLRHQQENNES